MIKKIIKSIFKKQQDQDALWLYFECDACGEKIKVRVNKKTDLEDQYGQEPSGRSAYSLRKEIIGSGCFNLIFADVRFDSRYNIMTSKMKNGKLITKAEYEK